MPATIHFISKTTGVVYGVCGTKSISDLDNLIAEYLGLTPNPEEWCNAWYNMIAYDFAMNVSEYDMRANFDRQEAYFPGWKEKYKVPATLDWLIENFYIRNDWGDKSTIKALGEPSKAKKRRAGV
jgi:hypothetical protein